MDASLHSSVTVCCVLYRDKEHTTYDVGYVEKLQRAVKRSLPDHRFVCYSNVEEDLPCERLPLPYNWKGWWSKMSIFDIEILPGPVLYFDLDTIITGDLTPFADRTKTTLIRGLHGKRRPFGSGVMFLTEDVRHSLFSQFRKRAAQCMNNFRGDQDYISTTIEDAETWQEELPDFLVSYKLHCVAKCGGELPPLARVVCFHGKPRPADMPQDHWIHEYWR
jgi:hypothetical protein